MEGGTFVMMIGNYPIRRVFVDGGYFLRKKQRVEGLVVQ
jgi:hypothetical protein